jgi:rare lipoprotein A
VREGRAGREAEGLASFYGEEFEGRLTASGIVFDKDALVAAHPSYPFGTRVRVENLDNGRAVTLRIVDRGPSAENVREGVIIDVSKRAAQVLGFVREGRQRVRVVVVRWGNERPPS